MGKKEEVKKMLLCPCGSKKNYAYCCRPYHDGKLPESALLLMKSRYSAYARNLPEYIISTTHPENPHRNPNQDNWKRSIVAFSEGTEFERLEVLDFQERGNKATVTFTAYLLQDGKNASFTEKSFFEKIGERWLYQSGEVQLGNT
ncbi:MAG: YchJ family metal-binding protein [Candidatus Algichlamydia australiensis]|nr:YchJ family metal-binding protein [Chlamydiales bacterium]